MPHPIVAEELALLEEIRQLLDQSPPPASASEAAVVRELERLREVLFSGEESKDLLGLEDEWRRLTAILAQLRRARDAPDVDPGSPYFAHMRLREGERERDLFLGKATHIERGIRIVDWRNAPVSRVFYRYDQGDDYEEEMGGRLVEGRVVARRSVAIEAGRLERVESPEGIFVSDPEVDGGWREAADSAPRLGGGQQTALRVWGTDGAGARRLGTNLRGERRRSDKHLADIAALIDRDQFELISRPDSGLVVVRGGAGSGKTTVALHRIAYLAYEDPGFDSPRTLFIVFSPALKSYVSHVLPALGVERVRVLTYQEWAAKERRRLFPKLPRDTRYDTPAPIRRLKLHQALSIALAEQIAAHPGEPDADQVFDDWASVLCNRSLLEETLAREAPGAFSSEALDHAVQWCRERNDELHAWLDGDLDAAELDVEDDALLLRAWQLRVGPISRGTRPLRYRHVAIDEVQDFSPLEVQVLLECTDERRSVTLAGDTQQHVLQDTGFTSWDQFFAELGLDGPDVHTLRVSYRSTDEITRFAHELLGDLAEEEAPRTVRSGPPVELFRFTDHGACVGFLADALKALERAEPLASLTVLCASSSTADLYAEGLHRSEVSRLHRVTHHDFRFTPGVEVAEIEQAKGLEFDYVILVDVSAAAYPDRPMARRQLHVGATRAVHQLWVTSVGPPPRWVTLAAAKLAA